ncbi:MAG: hypothetical protein EZS28_021908 [Streblomastix strix]|uniref:RRM domain-containing protein n=1 Tax=Streblomastix strix TaxID=222440 RepID=A0A5J4VJ94_9EUKA|nr:MAG: hypothetical protein EZS28_021908 [Streblomastix strix]
MKKSRIEDSEVELAEELKMVPPDLFEKYGEFYVICGNMPAETESNNLREFLEQFGQIQYLWLENQNGQCSRQAMVFFSSQEELENSIQSKTQIFNSFTITIELCKQELKQLSQQFFLLNNEKKIEIQKNNAQQFLDQDIIRHIRDILTKINTNRIESKNLQRILPSLSPNDLLMTKYACAILSNIIYFFPTSAFVAQKCKIPNQLMNLLQTLPIDCVNHHHIVVLSDVIQGSDRELKQDLKMNGGLQTLSHLLEHTNLNVKSDSIQLMMNILNSEERYEKRVSHPLFTNLQRSGVIFQIYQCGLIHGKTEDDINNSAIVLGILLKAQEVDQNMKKSLIQQIKAMIGEQNNPKLVANALDMICGLAVRKSNINEIVSDKFIQTISELSKCHDTNLKSYVLELLLILIDSGGTELEKEIINSVDIVKFLELIGDSDSYLDEQILIRVMKWSKDVQILNIQNLFEELKRFNIANEEQKKKILSSNIIPTILSHLNITNEQIVELNENNELIPTQTIGLINSCCVSLVSVSDHNEESAIEIIKTGILTQLQILLQHVPLEQIGTVQMLIRFFEHPSSSVALLAALIICNIINSGMKYQSTQIGQYSYHSGINSTFPQNQ